MPRNSIVCCYALMNIMYNVRTPNSAFPSPVSFQHLPSSLFQLSPHQSEEGFWYQISSVIPSADAWPEFFHHFVFYLRIQYLQSLVSLFPDCIPACLNLIWAIHSHTTNIVTRITTFPVPFSIWTTLEIVKPHLPGRFLAPLGFNVALLVCNLFAPTSC